MGTSDDVERIAAPLLQAAGLDLVDVELRSGQHRRDGRPRGRDRPGHPRVHEQDDFGCDRPRGGRTAQPVRARGLEPGPGATASPARALSPVRRPTDLTSDAAGSRRRAEARGRACLRRRPRNRRDGARAARRWPAPRVWRHRKSPHDLRLEGGVGAYSLADGPQRQAPRREGVAGGWKAVTAPRERWRTPYELDEFRPPGGAPADRRGEGHRGRHIVRRAGQRARGRVQAPPASRRGGRRDHRPGLRGDPRLRPGAGRRRKRTREWDDTPDDFGRIAAQTAQAGDPPAHPRGRARPQVRGVRRARGRHRHGDHPAERQSLHPSRPRQGRGPAAPGRAGPLRALRPRCSSQGLHRRGPQDEQRSSDRRLAQPPRAHQATLRARGARDLQRGRRDQGLCP